MPLEFLPNQPIVFENPIGDYPCLNNDPTTYGPLAMEDDSICVQWKLAPCGEPLCEPNMIMDPVGSDELGAWTAGDGWSTTGSDNLSYAGPDVLAVATQSFTSIENTIYNLSFEVQNYTGTSSIIVVIGSNTVVAATLEGNGIYNVYFTAYETPINVSFITVATDASDTWEIVNLELKQWTDCWQDEAPDDLPTWSYSYDTGEGKFCSLDTTQGDLINTTAFTTIGNYHRVTMVISDCTLGGIEVRLGSVLLGTTSGNGQFEFYGVPTAGTDLVFTKVDDFDGCISQVNVEDFGDPSNARVRFINHSGSTYSNYETPTFIKDRLIWCSPEFDELTWTINGTPDLVLQCDQLKVEIDEPCAGDTIQSVNYINFNRGGWECSKVVEAWNDGYAFGFYFGDINNPDFKLIQRLRVLQFSPVYRNSGEEYLYSSGASGRSYAQSQKARTAWFDYVDEYTHDCIRTQLLSSKLFVDGYAFFYPVEDYEPEWNDRGKYNLAQSRVTLLHEEAIFGSTCGTMANSVCPPQVIQLPCEFEQVQVLLDELDTSGLDLTVAELYCFEFDDAGVMASFGFGAYDLTNGIDRAAFATQIANMINSVFGTTTTSTACTVSGSLLSINVICEGTISLPMNSVSFSLFSIGSPSFSLPIYYA